MSYTDLFYKHIMFRKSCGACHYTNLQRPSDITLGDFWHSQNIDPELHKDNKGMSIVLANTEKGKKLLQIVKSDFATFQSVDVNKAMQRAMREPNPPHKQRDEFEECYKKNGFEYTYKKYTKLSLKDSVQKKIKCFRKNIKKILKKL